MKIRGKIIKVLTEVKGVSQTTGQPWRKVGYVVQEDVRSKISTVAFDVFDGAQGRIDRLNLQEGQTYDLFMDGNAREYSGRWYNSLQCWDARPVIKEDNSAADAPVEGPLP